MTTDAHTTSTGAGPLIRVFLVDDHELVRRGLCDVLMDACDITVVGEAGSAEQAIRRIPESHPDVVLMDVRLPDGSGIDVCREVRSRVPSVRVLMLTSYDDRDALIASVRAGASGFALKQIRSQALTDAVRGVAAGRSLTTAGPGPVRMLGRTTPTGQAAREPGPERVLATLTGQESRVLDAIVEGLTNREIGERLGIAEQTVKNHVTGLLAKLGVRYRTQAAVIGAQARQRSPWPAESAESPPGERR